jgi:arsenate reductase
MKRVLFVCIGNACRSQMAEGFARAYGRDVIVPASAGTNPALDIPSSTWETMLEKNIDIGEHFPKPFERIDLNRIDLVVNMSGRPLPGVPPAKLREWAVADPIGKKPQFYRETRDLIENYVMALILELRNSTGPKN